MDGAVWDMEIGACGIGNRRVSSALSLSDRSLISCPGVVGSRYQRPVTVGTSILGMECTESLAPVSNLAIPLREKDKKEEKEKNTGLRRLLAVDSEAENVLASREVPGDLNKVDHGERGKPLERPRRPKEPVCV